MRSKSWRHVVVSLGALMGTLVGTLVIPYEQTGVYVVAQIMLVAVVWKHVAWLLLQTSIGFVLAPMAMTSSSLVMQAAAGTRLATFLPGANRVVFLLLFQPVDGDHRRDGQLSSRFLGLGSKAGETGRVQHPGKHWVDAGKNDLYVGDL